MTPKSYFRFNSFLVLALLITQISFANKTNKETNPVQKEDSIKQIEIKGKVRSYLTTRLTSAKPRIDGVLDDKCWEEGAWAGNFVQWVPKEGGKPSQSTELKILYDDKNVYVGIRAYDNEPEKIQF